MLWSDLLNKIITDYPFLEKAHFGLKEAKQFFPLPDWIKLYSYACFQLLSQNNKKLALILPYTDSVSCWLAILTAFQCIVKQTDKDSWTLPDLKEGDKVLLDGTDYQFKGTEIHSNGTPLFVFEYDGGTQKIPQSQRLRIQHSTSTRKLTKKDKHPIRSVLDSVLGTKLQGNTSMLCSSVLLISGISETRENVSNLRVTSDKTDSSKNLNKLLNTIGWCHMGGDGDLKVWGSSGKDEKPLIITACNVIDANEYLEEADQKPSLIIIDGAEYLRNYLELKILLESGLPVLFVLSAKHIDAIREIKELNFEFWTWNRNELKEFFTDVKDDEGNPFSASEQKIHNFIGSKFNVVNCSNINLERAFKNLRKLSKQIDEDDLQILQITEQLFGLIVTLTRQISISETLIESNLLRIIEIESQILNFKAFINIENYEKLNEIIYQLKECLNELQNEESKAAKIFNLINNLNKSYKSVGVILGNINFEENVGNLKKKTSHIKNINFIKPSAIKNSDFKHLIICGYLKKTHMLNILDKCSSGSIDILTYGFERDWVRSIKNQYFGVFEDETLRTFGRFASINIKHTEHNIDTNKPAETNNAKPIPEIEDFELKISEYKYRRVIKSINEDFEGQKVEAHCISFKDEKVAFLTDTYTIPVVTDIISHNKKSEEIPFKKVAEIHTGDFLLFRDSSSVNLIRDMADIGLKAKGLTDLRNTSSLWRDTLKTLYEESNRDISVLKKKLSEYGCAKNPATIKNWMLNENLIAPRDEMDITAITYAAGDDFLEKRLSEIKDAIEKVRSAHMQASRGIIKKINFSLSKSLSDISESDLSIDVEGLGKIYLVCVENIDHRKTQIPFHRVNKLISLSSL